MFSKYFKFYFLNIFNNLNLCFQLKQNLASEKRLSKSISQQHEDEIKRYTAQQKTEYKYLKDRLKRVSNLDCWLSILFVYYALSLCLRGHFSRSNPKFQVFFLSVGAENLNTHVFLRAINFFFDHCILAIV